MASFEVIAEYGTEDVAKVYVARLGDGSLIEMVESVQPPIPREDKWVVIISVLRGCPVRCPFCDANRYWKGPLSAEEMLDQIDFLVNTRWPAGRVRSRKFKIQFARMGEPALNDAVLDVLELLPSRVDASSLMPSISTVAPASRDEWFERLLDIKERLYPESFQFQFSIHTTDQKARRELIPIRTWTFERMASYGRRMASYGRKVTLNFATPRGYPLEPEALARVFPPEHFIIKFTPINPTVSTEERSIEGVVDPWDEASNEAVVGRFRKAGYDVILSIGELRENEIGSNCGMFVTTYLEEGGRAGYGLVRDVVNR